MHVNKVKYRSNLGEIKQSHAYEKFTFEGKTSGIALKYVIEGSEDYLIDDQVIHVQQRQFILVKEGLNYKAGANLKSKHIKGLCIDLNPTALDTDQSKLYENPLLFNLPFDCFYSTPLFENLHITLSKTISEPEQLQILKTLNKQVQTFADEIDELHLRLSIQTKKVSTQRDILCKVLSSKNFIHRFFNEKIKLDQLAKYVGISKFHFVRLFKLCFDQSPLELQNALRMESAIEMIKNHEKNLSSIAYDLGYKDLGSFSKKFKKEYGHSPLQYRKQLN